MMLAILVDLLLCYLNALLTYFLSLDGEELFGMGIKYYVGQLKGGK